MSDAKRETILVVDDHEINRYTTTRLLRSGGFATAEAGSGQEGITVAAKTKPDLIILDVNLPDMDGFEVCKVLRSLPETKSLPIIHVSATFVTDSDRVQGLEGGADGYLIRPLDPLVLLATVRASIRARRAEDAVVRSQRELQSVADNSPDILCRFDTDLNHVFVNAAVERVAGIPAANLIGKSTAEWPLSAELSRTWDDAIRSVLDTGSPASLDFDFPSPEGEISFSMRLVPERTDEGQIGSVLCVLRDVTERRRIELQRESLLEAERMARAEADRTARARDEFLATLSHELRTPITAIIGWTHVMKQSTDNAVWHRGIEIIARNAKLQADLINELLEMNRIASGKLRLNLSDLLFHQVVRDAVDSILPSAQIKSIGINVQALEPDAKVRGDASRLQQVVWNILTNAVKFTPEHGTISLSLTRDGAWVILSIRDSGVGINPEFLGQLFDRFSQADSSAARKHGGLGIGLSIAKQIVELHGGTITASSEGPGQGSTFTVTLPMTEKSVAAETDRRTSSVLMPGPGDLPPIDVHAADGIDLAGVHVMLVDDQTDSLEFATRLLEEVNAEVTAISSASDALATLRSDVPHLLISDIGMPNLDGYTFITRVRSELGLTAHQLPAIAISAFSREQDRDRALSAGFQEHIAKPINPASLLKVISMMTHGSPRSPQIKDRQKVAAPNGTARSH